MKSDFLGYRVAVASFVVMFLNLGLLGSTGVFIPYISKSLGVEATDMGLMVTFATMGAFIFSMFTNRLIKKLGAKKCLIFATLLNAIHFSIMGSAPAPWVVFSGAFIGGMVMAFGSNVVCAQIISKWFIEKRNTVLGLVFSGAGLGSAFALFVAGYLIRIFGWRGTYFTFTGTLLMVGLITICFFISESPDKVNQKPLGWNNAEELQNAGTAQKKTGCTLEEAKKTSTYWFWKIGILLSSMVITGAVTYLPSYWQSYGMDSVSSSSFTSVIPLLGAVSSLLSGMIADKFGTVAYFSYTLLSYIVGGILLVLNPMPTTMLAWVIVILIAVSYPSSANYPATITPVAFGTKDYTKINASFQTMVFLSKAILPIIIVNISKLGVSLRQAYAIQIGFAVIGFVLLLAGLAKVEKTKNWR